jgi:hypothetical protein
MNAKGKFAISAQMDPPYDVVDGVVLGRATFTKQFEGPLDAKSQVQMIAARTPVEGSAGYVAIERVSGTLVNKTGTFVLQHFGTMRRGSSALTVEVVPDSGTGELRGLTGRMRIDIVEGQHYYDFEYELLG